MITSHTPEDAAKLWCPASRLSFNGANRSNELPLSEQCRCMGPACMWWQWDPLSAEKSNPNPRTQAEKIAMAREEPAPTRGGCGAAVR